ncbi:hypothetical protein H8959_021758 [Pygathrix nigripes]
MRQSVESDIHWLRKVTDDTNVTWLQLETAIKALKVELLFMKKNHEEETDTQYDELAQKNPEELDMYGSQQTEESTTVVTTQAAEIRVAEMILTELRHTVQSLEIDLD